MPSSIYLILSHGPKGHESKDALRFCSELTRGRSRSRLELPV